jgi:hypothetical protein
LTPETNINWAVQHWNFIPVHFIPAYNLPVYASQRPLIEGFSHFVTSMTAPIASGWSGCRVGLTPNWKAPPLHGAHPERTSRKSVYRAIDIGRSTEL